MMKMTAKMFGVLCAASLVFCAACDGIGNKPEDEDNGNEDNTVVTVSYDVGKIVPFEGKDYLVVKNTAVGSDNAGENATVKYYPNTRADAYRDQLLTEQGMTEYVVLFDTAVTATATTYRDDTYMILHDGKKCYRIRYRWEDWLMFPDMGSSSEEKAERVKLFNEKPVTELRKDYDPTAVVIDNYKAVYGSDLSKKIFNRYAFNYGTDGKSVVYTAANFRETESYKDYVQINGKERNRYSIYDKIQENACIYKLRNPNLDTDTFFFEFWVKFEEDRATPKLYRLIANGTGTKEGSASSSLYRHRVEISKVEYKSSLDNVQIKGSVKIEKEDTTEKAIDMNVAAGFEEEWVNVSSRRTSVGGFNVPATITFSASFGDSSAPLNAYTKVVFVPETKNGGIIYVPKTDDTYPYDFLAQFAKNYQMLFGAVSLQPDSDIESDKETPRFTFSSDSLRIELEDMKHNFVLAEESAASGGTAGKLVDEKSRAEAIITFPAGNYEGYAVIRAPSPDNDAFYVKFGDDYIRMYADDPLPAGFAPTTRTPINLSCSEEMTVRMTILKDSPNKPGETGMFIDYVEFTKTGSQAGQGGSGSETPEAGMGKADWIGFTMVDSADKLDFTAHSYEYKEVCYVKYKDTSMLETRISAIEIVSSDEVTFAYKLKTEEYYDDASYNKAKEEIGGNPKYSYDDSTRTITKTYSEVDTMTFAELKDGMSLPEDEIDDDRSWTYTDKKLGIKDGVIQMSFTETYARTDDASKRVYYYTITLTPQQ